MSFSLPTEIVRVDKAVDSSQSVESAATPLLNGLHSFVKKYSSFSRIVQLAGMVEFFKDPTTSVTIFVPLDLPEVFDLSFEQARTIVKSLTVSRVLTTTMIAQSRMCRYRTLDNFNTLTFETTVDNIVIVNGTSRFLVSNVFQEPDSMVHLIDKFPYF
jgi:hypothetical protein